MSWVKRGALGFVTTVRWGSAGGLPAFFGVTGVNLEINFTPELSLMGGFGMGKGFQNYNLQVKRVLGKNSFLPYVFAGFTHWSGTGTSGDVFPHF